MTLPNRRFVGGLAALAVLTAVLASAGPALGHAELLGADPAVGSTVTAVPARVSATFDDDLDATKTSIVVAGPDGSVVGQGGVTADDSKTMAATITAGGPGAYEVRWTAASSDGDIVRGTYGFTVSAAAPSPTGVASAAASPAPTAVSGPPGSPTGGEGIGIVIAAAVVGLVLGGGIAWWRRRQRPA